MHRAPVAWKGPDVSTSGSPRLPPKNLTVPYCTAMEKNWALIHSPVCRTYSMHMRKGTEMTRFQVTQEGGKSGRSTWRRQGAPDAPCRVQLRGTMTTISLAQALLTLGSPLSGMKRGAKVLKISLKEENDKSGATWEPPSLIRTEIHSESSREQSQG